LREGLILEFRKAALKRIAIIKLGVNDESGKGRQWK